MQAIGVLSRAQQARYEDEGFVRLPGFAGPDLCQRMLERVGPGPINDFVTVR